MSSDSSVLIYLDNASTSYPKPEPVVEAVVRYMRNIGANPGRGAYRTADEAARMVAETRQLLADLIHAGDPANVAFTGNCTGALNLALKGFLRTGDHVITTTVEHNAVARPLKALEAQGVSTDKVAVDHTGSIDLERLAGLVRPNTRLIAVTAASNISGALTPLKEIGEIARERGVVFLVDAAQYAGHFPLDVTELGIDILALACHKGLLAPQGTGALYVSPEVELPETIQGGTGSKSDSLQQPPERPGRYESGTLGLPGIAGLGAALRWLAEVTLDEVSSRERRITAMLVEGLSQIERVRVLGPPAGADRAPVVSFTVDGMTSDEVAFTLDRRFGIASRAGLHCAGDAHRSFGTLETGTARLSPGYFTTEDEAVRTVAAVAAIAREL